MAPCLAIQQIRLPQARELRQPGRKPLHDPFDRFTPDIQRLPDGSILIDGMALIEEVNNQLGLDLHDPNYDTIAGYFLGKIGRIPKIKDSVEENGIRMQVEAMDGLRIDRLSLTVPNRDT